MANTPKKSVSKPAVKAPKSSSATPIYDSVVKEKRFDPLKPKKSVSKPAVKAPVKKKVR
jgi:hypothetical protein